MRRPGNPRAANHTNTPPNPPDSKSPAESEIKTEKPSPGAGAVHVP